MIEFERVKALLAVALIAALGKYCVTTSRHVETLTREHRVEEKVFEVSGPLVVHGQTQVRTEKHSFSVMPPTTLQGRVLHARPSKTNEHGQDVILHYEDSVPPSRAVLLFGADDAVSSRLRTLAGPLGQPGSTIRLEGASIHYTGSTWDGNDRLHVNEHLSDLQPGEPPREEVELTDRRFLGKKFHYFLVTGIPDQD